MVYVLFSRIKISNGKVSKVLKDLSNLSFGIYLIHQPILNMIIGGFKLDVYSKVLYFIVYIFCALLTKVIKKIPYLRVIMP